MTWQDKIPGCFGNVDREFAVHPLDGQRAIRLLLAAKQVPVSYSDVEDAITACLAKAGCKQQHIRKQIRRVKKLFGPWF